MMDYQKVLDYLKDIEARGIHPGLETTRGILDHFPGFSRGFAVGSRKARIIQVAGTNGKGSTAHFLTSIFQSAGYRVGLFTSPHLQDIRERITINRQWISKEDFSDSLWKVKGLAESLLKKGLIRRLPTYFETIFLAAVNYFLLEKVDIVILEVGLGGRLDATSTITPDVSVITTIAKDHTSMLGTRLEEIAGEKAGIIKEGVPVVCGCPMGSTARRVIKAIAARSSAPFFNVIDNKNRLEIHNNGSYQCCYHTDSGGYNFAVRLNGTHQAFNAAAAVRTIQVLNQRNHPLTVPRVSIVEGISGTFVPGRLEILDTSPPVILDGSHNVESTTALAHFLQEKKKDNLTLVFGILADKNYKKIVSLLLPYISRVILTNPLSTRALPPGKMLKLFKDKPAQVKTDPKEAYKAAQQFNNHILITGSFYLVGAMRKIILAEGKNGNSKIQGNRSKI